MADPVWAVSVYDDLADAPGVDGKLVYATGDGVSAEGLYQHQSGSYVQIGTGGGSAIALDLGDDGSNESTDLVEIATDNDANSIFQEPSTDKLLIDVGANWPTADTVPAGAIGSSELASGAVSEPKLDVADSPSDGEVLAWNNLQSQFEWVASGGGSLTQIDTGTVTATGGSSPAVDTTLAAVSTSQLLDYIFTVYVDSDPTFDADYAWNYTYSHQWDDSTGELDILLTVNWDTDPGSSNDVTLRYEVLQP